MQTDEISVSAFKKIKDQKNVFLLDVREPNEYQARNLGGYLIPLGELVQRYQEVPADMQVIVHCRGGGAQGRQWSFLKKKDFQMFLT